MEVPTSATTERVTLFATANWVAGPTSEVSVFAWSAQGHVSLWGYADRTEVRNDDDIESAEVDVRARQIHWDVSGRRPLLGPAHSGPEVVELVDLHERATGITVPATPAPIGFSADGLYFAGLTGTRGPSLLHVTACTAN